MLLVLLDLVVLMRPRVPPAPAMPIRAVVTRAGTLAAEYKPPAGVHDATMATPKQRHIPGQLAHR